MSLPVPATSKPAVVKLMLIGTLDPAAPKPTPTSMRTLIGVGVIVGVLVLVGVRVAVLVTVTVGVLVGVSVRVGVGVLVGVFVGVRVFVGVKRNVGVKVCVGPTRLTVIDPLAPTTGVTLKPSESCASWFELVRL